MSDIHHDYAKATFLFRIIRILVQLLFRLLFRIEIQGLDNLPRKEGYLLAGNHLSWLDPFLMLAFAPAEPRIYFTGDKYNMTYPSWRRIFTQSVGGVILVERGESLDKLNEQVREVLHGGGVLGIFPEGAVSDIETGQLLPFRKGAAHFALNSQARTVPVAFQGTKEPYLRKRIRVIIGQPLSPLNYSRDPGQQDDKEIVEQQSELIAQAIQKILPPPPTEEVGKPMLLHDFFTYMFMTPKEIAQAKAKAQSRKD